jgi:hypothetical protein
MKKFNTKNKSNDHLDLSREKIIAARRLRRIINFISFLLPFVFGWLKFKDVNMFDIIKLMPPDFILKTAISIYFVSWIAGVKSDLSDMELVLIKSPRPIHINISSTLLGLLIAISFGMVCYFENIKYFSLSLLTLIILNIISWLFMTKVAISSAYDISLQLYKTENKLIKREQLDVVTLKYQKGTWQIYRFIFGFMFCITANVFSFQHDSILKSFEFIRNDGATLSAMTFFCYVLIFEGWVWFMRMRVKGAISSLEECEKKYHIQSKLNTYKNITKT